MELTITFLQIEYSKIQLDGASYLWSVSRDG